MFWTAVLAALSIAGAAQLPAQPDCSQMLARVQKGDMTVDFRAFRVAGSHKSGPQANNAQETQERIAFKNVASSGDWTAALDVAMRALGRDYASPIAHFDAMSAYQSLGKSDEAAFHEKILNALLDSIRQSGDGKGPETAYLVVSVQEEYIFLNRILHLRAASQATAQKEGHTYDRLTVSDPSTGQTQDIWFNADYDFPK